MILSHAQAVAFVPPATDAVLVRIVGNSDDFIPLSNAAKYKDVLEIRFEDVSEEAYARMDEGERQSTKIITGDDAKAIANFIRRHGDVRLFVVHCAAGRHRSAAVALAFAESQSLTEAIRIILDARQWAPNRTVHRAVMKSLGIIG